MKRNYIWILLIALVGVVASVFAFSPPLQYRALEEIQRFIYPKETPFEGIEIRGLRQIVTAQNDTSRLIMWHMTQEISGAKVEYRKKGSSTTKVVEAEYYFFEDDKEKYYVYKAFLDSLEPNSDYEYRLGKEGWTSWHSLKTSGNKSFKILLYPDSQSADFSGWNALVKKSWERHRDAQLVVNVGDLVDNGESAAQWKAWFNSMEDMTSEIPLAPLMGNHETYDLNWKIRKPLAYLNYFSLPSNGVEEFQNHFYSFDFGPVHFVMLDTQFKEEEEFWPHLKEVELAWLREDLSKTDKEWKIVVMHKDVLTYSNTKSHRPAGINDLGKAFMPIFEEYGVDAVFSGHYHTYRRRGHIKDFVHHEEGPLYVITGVAGDVRYPRLWLDHYLDVFVAPQPETANYVVLEIEKEKLKLSAYLPDGSVLDSYEMVNR